MGVLARCHPPYILHPSVGQEKRRTNLPFAMAAFHLLFLLLALAASCNISTAAASAMYKAKASVIFRHDARTIEVKFILPASNSAVAAGDEDLQLRQEAMAQAITVISRHRPETSDAEKFKWALGVVNLEAQRWKPIFRAVSTVLESGADDGTKEEAFTLAKEELNRELGQEGPNALKIDFGYM
ncbi:hypothetical protein ACQJBY_030426 [Aegilops geniculata]